MRPDPIFFAWTRSFWLGLFPALLTALDILAVATLDPTTGAPMAALLAAIGNALTPVWNAIPVLPDASGSLTAEGVQRAMQVASAFAALIVGQQRMGAARPYTLDPRARK